MVYFVVLAKLLALMREKKMARSLHLNWPWCRWQESCTHTDSYQIALGQIIPKCSRFCSNKESLLIKLNFDEMKVANWTKMIWFAPLEIVLQLQIHGMSKVYFLMGHNWRCKVEGNMLKKTETTKWNRISNQIIEHTQTHKMSVWIIPFRWCQGKNEPKPSAHKMVNFSKLFAHSLSFGIVLHLTFSSNS